MVRQPDRKCLWEGYNLQLRAHQLPFNYLWKFTRKQTRTSIQSGMAPIPTLKQLTYILPSFLSRIFTVGRKRFTVFHETRPPTPSPSTNGIMTYENYSCRLGNSYPANYNIHPLGSHATQPAESENKTSFPLFKPS